MTKNTCVDPDDWVSLREIARRIGKNFETVKAWADRGLLTSRRIPGCRREYSWASVVDLAGRSIEPARYPANASAASTAAQAS